MVHVARLARDLFLIAVGAIAVAVTPASLRELGVFGALAVVWAAMIGVGAAASLYGLLRRNLTAEIYGCMSVGMGFAAWAVAAVLLPGADATSWMIALVFLSITAGQFYRVGMITEGRVAR